MLSSVFGSNNSQQSMNIPSDLPLSSWPHASLSSSPSSGFLPPSNSLPSLLLHGHHHLSHPIPSSYVIPGTPPSYPSPIAVSNNSPPPSSTSAASPPPPSSSPPLSASTPSSDSASIMSPEARICVKCGHDGDRVRFDKCTRLREHQLEDARKACGKELRAGKVCDGCYMSLWRRGFRFSTRKRGGKTPPGPTASASPLSNPASIHPFQYQSSAPSMDMQTSPSRSLEFLNMSSSSSSSPPNSSSLGSRSFSLDSSQSSLSSALSSSSSSSSHSSPYLFSPYPTSSSSSIHDSMSPHFSFPNHGQHFLPSSSSLPHFSDMNSGQFPSFLVTSSHESYSPFLHQHHFQHLHGFNPLSSSPPQSFSIPSSLAERGAGKKKLRRPSIDSNISLSPISSHKLSSSLPVDSMAHFRERMIRDDGKRSPSLTSRFKKNERKVQSSSSSRSTSRRKSVDSPALSYKQSSSDEDLNVFEAEDALKLEEDPELEALRREDEKYLKLVQAQLNQMGSEGGVQMEVSAVESLLELGSG